MHRQKLWLGAVIATSWIAWVPGWSETVTYQRGTVIEAIQGRMLIDQRYEVGVEVPVADCPAEPYSCVANQRFSVAYRLRLQRIEIQTRQGRYRENVEPAGTIWIAATLTESEESAFEARLQETMGRLRGEAFGITYAGLLGEQPLHEASLVGEAEQDAWLCAADEYDSMVTRFFVERGPNGERLGLRSWVRPEYAPACEALMEAFSGTGPKQDAVETLVAANSLETTRLLTAESWHAGNGSAEALHPLPEGVVYRKRRPTAVDRGERPTFSVSPERVEFSTKTRGIWYHVEYAPTSIPIPARGDALWVSRWRMEREEQHFGSYSSTVESGFEFWLAALPIENPLSPGAPPVAPEIDWRAKLAYEFKRMPVLEKQAIIDAVSRIALSPSRNWIVVLCDDQDRATYSLVVDYRVEVENGEELCGHFKRQLTAPQ